MSSITNSSNKLIALATGVAVALALMGAAAVAPAQASALTQTQIQAIVSLLSSFGADQGTINNVTAALNGQATTGTSGSTTTGGACPALTRDLSEGSTGADVMALQQYLNSMAATQVAASGAGSPGMETEHFGPATQAAVIKLQTMWNISPNAGYVGPKTRAAIAANCGGSSSSSGSTGTTGGTLTVMAGTQPVNSLAPQGAARVPFTTFTIDNTSNAPVTVNSVTVQRTGLGVDANFSGLVLLDQNGLQIGTAQTLNSNHQANIGSSGFTIPANSSAMFTVAGNIATGQNTNGQVVSVEVVAVNTGATVSGSLPITGASQTINSTLTLGSVSTSTSSFDPFGAYSPNNNQIENIGSTAVRFSGVRFTAGSAEDLKLYSIRWRQEGTAGSGDIGNVETVVNGTAYPATVDSTGKYYTSTFPGGVLIPKGNSVDVYIQGDLTGTNSNLTVIMDIDKVTDVYFVGQLYGYGISPSGNWQPWFQGNETTIEGGQATTITKANSGDGAAQNVAINVNNQAMGGFTTNFAGEPVTVNGMTFTIATSTLTESSYGLFTSVSLVNSSGTVVAGPVDAVTAASGQTVTFTDSVTFPVGSATYYLEGKVPSTVTGGSFSVNTTPSSWTNPTGQNSGNTVSISTGNFQMNSMTVQPGSLTVSYASTPASQSIVPGVAQFTMANLNLDASQSGENVRLASVPVEFSGNAGDLSGCQLWNGSAGSGNALNNQVVNTINGGGAKTVFSLTSPITVSKGTMTTLALTCNVSSSATSSASFEFTMDGTTSDWSVYGATSGATITPNLVSGSVAGTMTVGVATLALSVDSSSPASTTVSGGSTGQTVGVYNLLGSNDTVTLNYLGLKLDGTHNPSDVTTVWLYDSSNNLLGQATFGSGQTTATSTLSKPLVLTPNTNTRVTVKADVADVGIGKPGTEGDVIAVDPVEAEGTGSSGTVYSSGASGTTAGVRLYNSYPTFSYSTAGGTLSNGVNTLLSLSVSADPAGDIGLYKLTFAISTTSGITISSPTFTGPNGNVASTSLAFGNNGTVLVVLFDSTSNTGDATVPAGTTKTYSLQATVGGITGTSGGTVSTVLDGDNNAQNAMAQAKGTGALVSGNLVWSPLATTTINVNTNDWTNGYALTKGCFAVNGLGSNCPASVVSK